ncbi:MAG: aerotolerance regulator BatA [Bacteroidetes bacterium CG2_30_33_31]|nr:MAG: aerotolerance regulator BatA [Bacteroidetes bacterium CG2_30_33_31]
MSFANPYWFLLLSLVPLIILWYILRYKQLNASLTMSSTDWLNGKDLKSPRQKIIHLPIILRLLTLIILTVIMARPQSSDSHKEMNVEGIDIVMAMDVSSSMLAMDFRPNRLEAAKKVAKEFISQRPNDRIGLVIFSGEAFTQCPLTIDHQVVNNLIDPMESGMIADGTALGDGLATAVNRIKDSEAISKVIILLTDGVQTAGSMDPATAAELAKTFGIRIYTIGVGRHGMAPYPVQTPFGMQVTSLPVEIDEVVLRKVAKITDGNYFRATSNQSLSEIYKQIDNLEKTRIEVSIFNNKYDQYKELLLGALAILLLEILVKLTILRTKP